MTWQYGGIRTTFVANGGYRPSQRHMRTNDISKQSIEYWKVEWLNYVFEFLQFLSIDFLPIIRFYKQWKLYNDIRKVVLKPNKFHHLPGMVVTKSCLFSLSWNTICLERPQNWAVALYRFSCICILGPEMVVISMPLSLCRKRKIAPTGNESITYLSQLKN